MNLLQSPLPDASLCGVRRVVLLAVVFFFTACATAPQRNELVVTATAYNSVPGQTQGDPALVAWGDRLEPGMKAIAVSRDLIAMGLGHRAKVRIEGFPGEYLVLDKLHRRWKRRIDIYMGVDVEAARSFGKRQVVISWAAPDAGD